MIARQVDYARCFRTRIGRATTRPDRYPRLWPIGGQRPYDEARRLAAAGYVAIVPHYFDRAKPDPENGVENARPYSPRSQTIRDVVGYASKRDDVDSGKIGILGSSLGVGEVRVDGIRRTLAFLEEHLKKAVVDTDAPKKGRTKSRKP